MRNRHQMEANCRGFQKGKVSLFFSLSLTHFLPPVLSSQTSLYHSPKHAFISLFLIFALKLALMYTKTKSVLVFINELRSLSLSLSLTHTHTHPHTHSHTHTHTHSHTHRHSQTLTDTHRHTHFLSHTSFFPLRLFSIALQATIAKDSQDKRWNKKNFNFYSCKTMTDYFFLSLCFFLLAFGFGK